MDAISIVAIISGLGGLFVAIGTHFKHSECCKGMFQCDTRTPPATMNVSPIGTPVVIKKEIDV